MARKWRNAEDFYVLFAKQGVVFLRSYLRIRGIAELLKGKGRGKVFIGPRRSYLVQDARYMKDKGPYSELMVERVNLAVGHCANILTATVL